MTSDEINATVSNKEKRLRSPSDDESNNDVKQAAKKQCKNGEKVKKDLSELMNSSSEGIQLVLRDSADENGTSANLSDKGEEHCGNNSSSKLDICVGQSKDEERSASDSDVPHSKSNLKKTDDMSIEVKKMSSNYLSSDSDAPLASVSHKRRSKSSDRIKTGRIDSSSDSDAPLIPRSHKKKSKPSNRNKMDGNDSSSDSDIDRKSSKKVRKLRKQKKPDVSSLTSDAGPDANSDDQKPSKESTTPVKKEKADNNESTSDSRPDPDLDDQKPSKESSKPVKKEKADNESTSDSGPDPDSDDQKPSKESTKPVKKEKADNNESTSDSGPDPDSDDQKPSKESTKPVKKEKADGNDSTSDSGPDPDLDSDEEKSSKKLKKPVRKSPSSHESADGGNTKKYNQNKKSKPEDMDPHKNPRIVRLKKLVVLTGHRIQNFSKFWEGCKSNNQRANKIKKFLADIGIEGIPSMQKCLEYKKKKEIAEELAVLQENVVINPNGRALRHRNENIMSPEPSTKPAKSVKRLKALFDSDSE